MKIIEISPRMFQVGDNIVHIKKKKGRTILTCSCFNSAYFGHNCFCSHREEVINYILKKPIRDKLDKLILVYKNWIKLKLPINSELCLNDLENLRSMLNANK